MQPVWAGKRSSRALTSSGQEHAAVVDTMHHRRVGIVLVEDYRVRNYSYHIERSPFESLQATDSYCNYQEHGHWNRILQSAHQSLTASETRGEANTNINISGSREMFDDQTGDACDCDDQEGTVHGSSGKSSSGHDDVAMGESLKIMDYIPSF